MWTFTLGAPDDRWDCNSTFRAKEEAIEAGREEAIECGEEWFHVGLMVPIIPSAPDAERVVEDAIEEIHNVVGDVCANWSPTKEQVADLDERLFKLWRKWLQDCGLTDRCYLIENDTEHRAEVK